jgi:N-acetylglucosamine kinase-like BadF-type ATPase
MALLAVGRARDGRGPATALTQAMLAQSPAKSFEELVRWSAAAEPGEVATLAPLVYAAAVTGDAIAKGIIEEAATALAELVTPLVALFGGRGQVRLALTGGNLAPERGLRAPVLARLHKIQRLTVREGPLDPAEGALALARESA